MQVTARRRLASSGVRTQYSLHVEWFPQAHVFEQLDSSWWDLLLEGRTAGKWGLAGRGAILRAGALRSGSASCPFLLLDSPRCEQETLRLCCHGYEKLPLQCQTVLSNHELK